MQISKVLVLQTLLDLSYSLRTGIAWHCAVLLMVLAFERSKKLQGIVHVYNFLCFQIVLTIDILYYRGRHVLFESVGFAISYVDRLI